LATNFYRRCLASTYTHWLAEKNPLEWKLTGPQFSGEIEHELLPLAHSTIASRLNQVNDPATAVDKLLTLPHQNDILEMYLALPDRIGLEESGVLAHPEVRLQILIHMLNTPNLAEVFRNIIVDINHLLSSLFRSGEKNDHLNYLNLFFNAIDRPRVGRIHSESLLDCFVTVAQAIFETGSHELVDHFIDRVIQFGFQYPKVSGANEEWELAFNAVHVVNIRTWLKIIAIKPRWTKDLLAALIVNLQVGGVLIRDNDLLQKDVSHLLNSDIAPSYDLLIKLSRLFPIYFNEIGAEGELRDISTQMDELNHRGYPLIHFLRKQSHVSSNSTMVQFVEKIFHYWRTKKRKGLKGFLPPEGYD
jgi:pyruvate,orthophosphate dikinase